MYLARFHKDVESCTNVFLSAENFGDIKRYKTDLVVSTLVYVHNFNKCFYFLKSYNNMSSKFMLPNHR